jgi:hypothetical protein
MGFLKIRAGMDEELERVDFHCPGLQSGESHGTVID